MPQPSSGLVFNRRNWPSFRPALTPGYIERIHELQRAFDPPVHFGEIPGFEKRARSLGQASKMPNLLDRYERLDADIDALEKAARAASGAWRSNR